MRVGMTREGIARWSTDGSFEVVDLPYPDLGALLHDLEDGWQRVVREAPVRRQVGAGGALPAPPVGPRSTVWGVGLNYRSKLRASGRAAPKEPVLFLRSSSTNGGPGQTVMLPPASTAVDFEGELAVIIGRRAHDLPASRAWEYVALIATANDLTARDVMRRTGNPTLAKSFPGFGPIGWSLATVDEFPDPDDLPIVTRVNGEERQRDRTSGMLFGVAELISIVSRYVELQPGDVVLTGTPAGTGDEDGRYLKDGDEVEVQVADLVPLQTVIGSPAAGEPG